MEAPPSPFRFIRADAREKAPSFYSSRENAEEATSSLAYPLIKRKGVGGASPELLTSPNITEPSLTSPNLSIVARSAAEAAGRGNRGSYAPAPVPLVSLSCASHLFSI